MAMIEDLIILNLQGHAGDAEREQLRRWRMRAPENEERYRALVDVWSLTGVASEASDRSPRIDELPRLAEVVDGVSPDGGGNDAPAARLLAPRPHPARRVVIIGALAAGFMATSFGVGAALARIVPHPTAVAYSEIVTGEGEMATFTLNDGTAIRVAPRSTLRFTQEGSEPVVWLDGRAFFGVESDSTRRFTVRTAHGEAVALGTRFEVSSEQEEFRVLVVEGNVRVSAAGAAVELGEGLMSESHRGAPPSTTRVSNVHEFLAWMGPTLMFRNTPLSRAIAEIENRYDVRVLLDTPALADLTITATFTGQNPERVVFVICEMIDAVCSVDPDGTLRIGQRSSTPRAERE